MASIKKITGARGVSYKITVSSGRTKDDRQIRHYMTWKPEPGMTARQIERELQRVSVEFEQRILYGFQVDNKQTFREYAEYCLTIRNDRPQTRDRVKRQLERINEYIGNKRLLDIRPRDLTEMYKDMFTPGSNRMYIHAFPAVDFEKMRGGESMESFARRCGVSFRTAKALCAGGPVRPQTAEKVEQALGKKSIFTIVNEGKAMTAKTIETLHGIVSFVFHQAERDMIIIYNPADRAILPKGDKIRGNDSLQPEEIKTILSALQGEETQFRLLVTMYIVTGCRRGELLALEWKDVDFDKGEIYIHQSANYTAEEGVFIGPTKTNETRHIALPKTVMGLLTKHKAEQALLSYRLGDMWNGQGLVFTRLTGEPIMPVIVNKWLTEFCKKNGLRHINPHLFRHTAATILLTNGVDVLTVSKMLGHANTSTTLDVYAHEIEAARKKTADCISEIFLEENVKHG